jgi:hypothetical protein
LGQSKGPQHQHNQARPKTGNNWRRKSNVQEEIYAAFFIDSGVQLGNNSLTLVERVLSRTPGSLDWLKTFFLDLFKKLPKQTKKYFFKVMLQKKNILIIFLLLLKICKTGLKRTDRPQDATIRRNLEVISTSNAAKIVAEPRIQLNYKDVGSLLAKGLGWTFQQKLCQSWKEGSLWCMTKYKPVAKKV